MPDDDLGRVSRFGVPWLAELGHQALDPGYREVSRRRAGGHARTPRRAVRLAWLVAAMLLAGGVIGIAVRSQQLNAPDAARAKDALLADIESAQQGHLALQQSASELAELLRSRQSALGAGGPLQTVADLERRGGLTPVAGPGLRVVIDGGTDTNAILDRDVQVLVNGLWAAGAEAVAVGGVRLRSGSAIRQAGGAILVDNTPTFWPLTIEAIGEPQQLHVAFAGTAGFGRFSAFAANYGVRFDVQAADELQLPAGAVHDLRYAQAGTGPAGSPGSTTRATAQQTTRATATPTG